MSAESHVSLGIFLGVNSLITGTILEGSRAQERRRSTPISPTADFGDAGGVWRDADFHSDPTIHARISRMTVVEQLPQITILILSVDIKAGDNCNDDDNNDDDNIIDIYTSTNANQCYIILINVN